MRHWFVELLHQKVRHSTVNKTLTTIQEWFWGRQAVKHVLRSCVICKKIWGLSYATYDSPDLPSRKKTWKSWSIMQEMKALCLFYSKATDVFLTLYHLRISLLFKYFTVVCNFNALDKWNTPPKLCYCRILCLHGQLLYIHSIIWEVRKKNPCIWYSSVQ